MRAAGAGWERTARWCEGRGFWCARVVSCGHGNVGDALCSHAIPHVIEKARRPGMVSGPEDAVGRATPLRGRVAAPRASSTSQVLGCVSIVAKVHLTKFWS